MGPGLYARISRLGFPKSYPVKVLLVVFLGDQAPLIAVSLCLLADSSPGPGEALRILALLAAVILAGNVATLLTKADAAMYKAKREERAWVLAG